MAYTAEEAWARAFPMRTLSAWGKAQIEAKLREPAFLARVTSALESYNAREAERRGVEAVAEDVAQVTAAVTAHDAACDALASLLGEVVENDPSDLEYD